MPENYNLLLFLLLISLAGKFSVNFNKFLTYKLLTNNLSN